MRLLFATARQEHNHHQHQQQQLSLPKTIRIHSLHPISAWRRPTPLAAAVLVDPSRSPVQLRWLLPTLPMPPSGPQPELRQPAGCRSSGWGPDGGIGRVGSSQRSCTGDRDGSTSTAAASGVGLRHAEMGCNECMRMVLGRDSCCCWCWWWLCSCLAVAKRSRKKSERRF